MLKDILAKPHVEFIEARDGGEAVVLYRAHHPDLVIMDIEMKPMDGIAATRALHELHPECRVLIVSKYDSPAFRHAAAAAGAFDYLLKDNLDAIQGVIARKLQAGSAL